MLGVAIAGVICGIVRFLGTGWIANRLLRSNWTTLAAVAERKAGQDRIAVAVSCSIAWPCSPRVPPRFPPRQGAMPPIFASFGQR